MSTPAAPELPPAPNASSRSTMWLVTLLGVAVSGVLVVISFRRVDWDKSLQALRTVTWWPWIPLAVGIYLFGQLIRGIRCALLVRGHAPLSIGAATNIVVAGYASNNVFPARLGELVRVGLLSGRTGMPILESLSLTALERIVDGITILAILAVATLNITTSAEIEAIVQLAFLVLGLAGLAIAVAVVRPQFPVTVASRIGSRINRRVHDRLVRFAAQLVSGVSNLRNPSVLGSFTVLSLLVWTVEAAMFVALLPAFGLSLNFWKGALAMGVTNLGILVPSTPGFVGTFHVFCQMALESQGVSADVGLSYAIVAHLTFFVPLTIWGAWALIAQGVSVGNTVATVRAAQSSARTKDIDGVTVHVISESKPPLAKIKTSAFLHQIIEALVARPGGPTPDGRAVTLATDFTQAQLGALSSVLRTAFAIGMMMFRTYVVLRFFRPFSQLPLETRRRAVESWAYGPIGLFRMLFRPVRGIALLAYFELQRGH